MPHIHTKIVELVETTSITRFHCHLVHCMTSRQTFILDRGRHSISAILITTILSGHHRSLPSSTLVSFTKCLTTLPNNQNDTLWRHWHHHWCSSFVEVDTINASATLITTVLSRHRVVVVFFHPSRPMSHIHTNIVESLSSILLSSTYLLLSNVAYDIIHYDNIGVSSASVVLITTIPSWHQWHHVAAVVLLLWNGQNGVNRGHSSPIFWRTMASLDMRFSLGAQKKIGLSKYDISFSFVCLLFLQKIKYRQNPWF